MFIGHFGIGFAAKKYAPGLSLGVLFIAAQFLDLLWPNLLLLGIENVQIQPGITKLTPLNFTHYPVSHSLLWVVTWGVLLGLLTRIISKRTSYAIVMFCCVVSHWFLDLLVHRPDLPLTPTHPEKYGLGLWDQPFISLFLEGLVFFIGIALYQKVTRAKDKVGKYGLVGLVIFFIVIHTANLIGPPPPDTTVLMWSAQLQWLFVILAFYIDKHRVIRV
jgi:membrane-bound metal-dependent hydrolase YbcI (DUF457 family)